MPRSIDAHKEGCPCNACKGPSVHVTVRLAPDVHEWLTAQSGGPRNVIETLARAAMGAPAPDRDWHYQHVMNTVTAAIREAQDAHGEILPGSVGKRVASRLWGEFYATRPDACMG